MPLALLLFLVVVSTGLGALRLLRLDRGWLGLGLAPAAGLSVVTIVATWADVAPLPEVIQTALLLALAVAGLLSAAPRARSFLRAGRLPVLLGLAILVPFAVLALAFAELEVPLSGHDGAHHIETIWALQHGARWSSWYPPGLHTMLAAILTGVPWVDTARAALDAAFGIALLAPLAAFGLGYTVTGRSGLAGVGALFLAFTVQYPYSPHLWSGWPVAAALLIALGLWSVGALYLRRPRLRLAVLAGLLLGAIVLVHGTELYTTALGLVILLVGAWRRVRWLRLLRDLLTAGGVAMIAALPYVPSVLGWAHAGGASDVAQEVLRTAATAQPNPGDAVMTLALGSLSGGFLLDLPIRAGLLALGLWLAVRRGRYRPLAALFAVAFGLALAFRYANVPVLSTIYALTFPWGEWIRLLMVASVPASLLQASALAAIGAAVRLPRVPVAASVTAAGLVLAGYTWATSQVLLGVSAPLGMYSQDDAAAMAWLRDQARPGDVVANDHSGDAGIWAPYKANVAILAPRLGRPAAEQAGQRAILDNLDRLDQEAATACAFHVRFVYHGARNGFWERRHFPSLDDLRASPALEQVFASGDAVVFRVRLPCDV